ncbi:polyphosphate polymerase domain-containing protein [Candidatus Saccharibacteria bacterium]|nr:polyphosphate polymerase domain-containing protein [Candidatus Saccharibacteria bacterium]
MDEKIFERVEKKYLISGKQKKALLSTIRKNMEKDDYFKSGIMNIYFDTDNYDLVIKSIDNPDFKEKVRARSYDGYDKVFLEIKTKLKECGNRVGHKRRFLISHSDFKELTSGKKTAVELASRKIETNSDIQIAKEIDYILNYFDLKPKILIYYKRESYVGENSLRITFDENLTYRNDNLSFVKKASDKRFFKDEKNIIMEVKTMGGMPLWLVSLLSKNKIYPVRFSKIGKIYELIRKEK